MVMTLELRNQLYRLVGTGREVVLYLPERHALRGRLIGYRCEDDGNHYELESRLETGELLRIYVASAVVVAYGIIQETK